MNKRETATVLGQMTPLAKQIYRLYLKDPAIVNDDRKLIAAVYRDDGWNDTLTLEYNLSRMPSPESITRKRRVLHEVGLIEYSKQAHAAREQAFVENRNMYSRYNPSKWFKR